MATADSLTSGVFELIWNAGPVAKFVLAFCRVLGHVMGADRGEVVGAPGPAGDAGLRQDVPGGPATLDGLRGGKKLRESPLAQLYSAGYAESPVTRRHGSGHGRRGRGSAHGAAGVRASGHSPAPGSRWRAGAVPAVPRDGRELGAVHRPVRDRVRHHDRVPGHRTQGSASLAVVAPGISEALIATAAGLGAAIPAVMGYNYFVNREATGRWRWRASCSTSSTS